MFSKFKQIEGDVKENELLTLPGKATATSLELPPRLDYAEWRIIGLRLAQLKEFSYWAIGDWLNYGEAKWGEKYTQAAADTGIPEDRLMIFKYVASRVSNLVRKQELKWVFHLEVAKLEPKQQIYWLELASSNGWKLQELRDGLTANGLRNSRHVSRGAEDELRAKVVEINENLERMVRETITCQCCGQTTTTPVVVCKECEGRARRKE